LDVTMTRIAAALLAASLAAPSAQAAELRCPSSVSDIRVDGLQRISAGTVFSYLPIEKGDRDRTQAAPGSGARPVQDRVLQRRRTDRQGDILVVTVAERPAISKLTLVGNKDIKTEELMKGPADIGLAEGETFDRSTRPVTQELTRQYNNRGKYNVRSRPRSRRWTATASTSRSP
jgi:outer membrane protein insertion porin family